MVNDDLIVSNVEYTIEVENVLLIIIFFNFFCYCKNTFYIKFKIMRVHMILHNVPKLISKSKTE